MSKTDYANYANYLDYFGQDASELKNKKLWLFDMDGTIYEEDLVFDGTLELLKLITDKGGHYVFITNNSSKSVADYIEKVNRLGIPANENNFFTSAQATILYLKEKHHGAKVYCQGTKSLVNELRVAGIRVTEEVEAVDVALVGFDTELTSQKIRKTCEILSTQEKVIFLATNPDLACPVSFGFIPDCGSICGMIENATGRKPKYIGKPDRIMVDFVEDRLNVKPENTIVVGDRLYTDITTGLNAGVTAVAVLTGETTVEEITQGNIKPSFTFNSVKNLAALLYNSENKVFLLWERHSLRGGIKMERVFSTLDQTIQKSTINDFKKYLALQKGVTKWMLSSDYCIKDKKKPNDVLSFVLFPYVLYLNEWQDLINKLQREDIKHTKEISDEFCKFTKSGLIFTFSFMLDRAGNCFDAWNDKKSMLQMVDAYIKMIDQWTINKPHNKEHYSKLQKSLKTLRADMQANSFNTPLLAETVITCFLASYIKYLLFKEVDVEIFSWLPDRDSMTSFSKGVYEQLYEIISYCLCETKLPEERKHIAEQVKDCLITDPNNNMFYDELVRVPDYFSGIIADHNMKDNSVSGEKQCKGVEQILADNQYLSIILVHKNGIARVGHYLKQTED